MWHTRTKLLLLCATIFVLYNDWIFGLFLNPHAAGRSSLISELSAQTQAFHWVFQSLDIIAGIMILLTLPWLWRFLRKFNFHYSLLLFITIATIGADNITDALLPLSCAPSVDTQCNLLKTHSLLTDAHLVESTAIGIVTFAAPLLWWWSCKIKHTFIAKASLWFVLLQVFVGSGITVTRFVNFNVTGAFQRIYVLGIGLWVTGILYIALLATFKQRKSLPGIQPNPDKISATALTLSYDE